MLSSLSGTLISVYKKNVDVVFLFVCLFVRGFESPVSVCDILGFIKPGRPMGWKALSVLALSQGLSNLADI